MAKQSPRRYYSRPLLVVIGLLLLPLVLVALWGGSRHQPGAADPETGPPAPVETIPPACHDEDGCDNSPANQTGPVELVGVDDSDDGGQKQPEPDAPKEADDLEADLPEAVATEPPQEESISPSGYQIFTGDEFNQLFNRVDLPNLVFPDDLPSITGDTEVDERIRQIAIDRGYRLRPMPADISRLVVVEADRHRLQPEAAQAYRELRAAAAAEGLAIWLVSAYRSYDYQRPLFLRQVEAPYSDDAVFDRLKLVAIPGYSKHHTGYTIDLAEGNLIFGDFADSASYAWLSANNYQNAKRHGWIPSYPPDADKQGPDPEPWEFTYVGRQLLLAPADD